jgi:pimeloyl-ACP methyl ester carboxylesterase
VKKGSSSFLKKRTKKLLQIAACAAFNTDARVLPDMNKSFLVLFFKKELLPFFCLLLAAAAPIKVGTLTLHFCNAEYFGFCGSITQPLDRSGGTPGTITVGFEYYPRTNTYAPPAGVILAQEGGPGYSTTGSRDGYVRLFAPLRTRRDILLIDKRGTGRSSPIDCPPLQKAYNPNLHDVALCARQLGGNAWFYRSADAADDIAAVLAALQLGPVDYYGDSYGTWFGQVFAVLHPQVLRTMVLDSAYPVLGDNSNSEVNHGQQAMEIACRRSKPCRALGGSARARFATLLSALRAQPVTGDAPGENGEPRHVTADPAGLFLIVANAGNAPATWRDLDAAGRAWLDNADPLPLLRLVAEARDSYSGGGSATSFSVGLADAVQCAEYGTNFSLYAKLPERRRQYERSLDRLRENHPDTYAPFTINDAVFSQMNAEEFDTCLPWPAPVEGIVPAQPIPAGSVFPSVPVLVLSGELDTVTSPSEGRATAALFPNSTYIETPNLVHESAIGDAGYFVPPNGQDLSQCIGPIVRAFVRSGGNTGDTGCLATIRPIRTVPVFAVHYSDVAPAVAETGNQVSPAGLKLASAVAETVGDAVARYYVTSAGHGAGLRGGSFSLSTIADGYRLTLKKCAWADDLTVTGRIDWHQITGQLESQVTFAAGKHRGSMVITWDDQQIEAMAQLSGTIDGATLAATRLAP